MVIEVKGMVGASGRNASYWNAFLLPHANKIWGKVIFSQACVSHSVHGGGSLYDVTSCLAGWSHVPSRGSLSSGGSLSRGCMSGGGGFSVRETPRTVKNGRYASYWNAFLVRTANLIT